ncbi:MAG: hypothetical protein GXY06_00650 [Clostridiaceae bacterium]|nr:hypothetical protein [Clostridiaceae bacterium]
MGERGCGTAGQERDANTIELGVMMFLEKRGENCRNYTIYVKQANLDVLECVNESN